MNRRNFLKRLLVVPAVPLMGKDMNFQEPEQVEDNGYTQLTRGIPGDPGCLWGPSASNEWYDPGLNYSASAVFYGNGVWGMTENGE